jgi:superoxide dismutase, Cu-Zn family
MKIFNALGLFGLTLVGVVNCGGSQPPAEEPPAAETPVAPPPEPPPAAAEAPPDAKPAEAPAPATPATIDVTLQPKSGSKLAGKATLSETPDGVKVTLSVEGIKPGDHGAHVHEKGDCSAADGASAGGHFNPGSHPHALPSADPRHLGDLGNIVVGKDGKGTHEITIKGANLKLGDPNSFQGKSIIIHEKKDDGGQPTGNAGGRIGCGEIK